MRVPILLTHFFPYGTNSDGDEIPRESFCLVLQAQSPPACSLLQKTSISTTDFAQDLTFSATFLCLSVRMIRSFGGHRLLPKEHKLNYNQEIMNSQRAQLRSQWAGTIHKLCSYFLLPSFVVFFSGCSVLIGNVKPVDEKDTQLQWKDLSQGGQWTRLELQALESPKDSAAEKETAVPDLAFQNTTTQAIISLNSACRESPRPSDAAMSELERLKTYTQRLHYGLKVAEGKGEMTQVDGFPAWDATVQGQMDGEPIALRTLVLQHDKCVYDLMYMTRPEHFKKHEKDFLGFVTSLRLRRKP